MMRSSTLNLKLPRYVPCVIRGISLAIWYETQEELYRVLCPQFRGLITCGTIERVYREMVLSERKGCQGCRARISFEKNPRIIDFILDFWCRTGNSPESGSWLAEVPQRPVNLWTK